MDKLVSVIIPSYNDGQYLKKSISSILAQTHNHIEIIIIDSSDDIETLDILKNFDNEIKCFHEPKKGVAAALNCAFKHARGDYIARMDADDISLPQRIAMQVQFLEAHRDVCVVGAQCDVIDEIGRIKGEIDSGCYSDSEIKSKLIYENCIIHPTVMMRAELVKAGWRYDESHYAEDLRLWMQMAANGIKFANLKDHLLLYRRYGKNKSSNSSKVAPSAAQSAREYSEKMFDIDVKKYDLEDFTRPYYSSIINKSKADFVISQLQLQRDIYQGNEKKHFVEQEDLICELNSRWKWVYEKFAQDVTYLCRKEIFCPETNDNIFFFDEIVKKLHLRNENTIFPRLKAILTVNERFMTEQRLEEKSLVIYGLGKRGKEILKEYEQKYLSGQINWKLVAVSDRKDLIVEYCGKTMKAINQDELVILNPDIVVISTDKFYNEIYTELSKKGLKSRIVDSNWIF